VTGDPIEVGRAALARHAWAEAYEALATADAAGPVSGEGLELLARAAYWTARPDETVELLERAYAAYLDEGQRAAASMAAFRLAEQSGMRLSMAQAQGWAAKAVQLAREDPGWPVHGWLQWMQGLMAWFQADFETAVERYDDALEFAAGSGDRDLAAMSQHDKGHALCLLGRVDEGLALLDECMATLVGGELDPAAAGYVYCGMIGVCSKLGDYARASEWTESTLRWCERQSVPAFPGVCRVHRAELLRLHGSLPEAEEQALAACEELPRFNLFSGLGPAHYEIGEVRRRLGDFAGAEEAYARADGYGFRPQPGRSLLRLAEGKPDAAAAGIGQALENVGGNHCTRVRLLAARAEIELATGDVAAAAATSDELDALVADFGAASLQAMAAGVRGAVLLHEGEAVASIQSLQRARSAWREIDAPYEAAEVCVRLARAYRTIDDVETAVAEARSARAAFEELGARRAAEQAAELVGELTLAAGGSERVGRAFLFTDIVRSTDLVQAIGDDAWEDLLAWHDRTLRSMFDRHGGEVGHPTGDGFFVAFPDAASAIHCAVDVQRVLAEQRRSQGFALGVRIGIHAGEATVRGKDYGGVEVHKAARIAAEADGGEILASRETVGAAGVDLTTADVGDVSLKGFAEPVGVVRVEWR
jgi:class 3 adenylate cyclase